MREFEVGDTVTILDHDPQTVTDKRLGRIIGWTYENRLEAGMQLKICEKRYCKVAQEPSYKTDGEYDATWYASDFQEFYEDESVITEADIELLISG